ncbi:MAG: carbohydrate kinase family protein, partial [Candidatus Jordarchaeum sp.]|uniref:carbohydrate kinase family protein n=1 Tax=Candidatus Jordarchaeum sp. TaxID=2823881 RepID=UPI00404AE3FA
SANVSIDLIKLGLKRGEVSSVGAVGEDFLGDFVEQTLNSYNVITHLIRTNKSDTSKDLILVVKGEDRRFHFDVGANLYLDPKFVKEVIKSETPLIFYGGAVGLLGEFDEKLLEVLKVVKELKCLTFLDPIRPYAKSWDFLLEAAPLIDIFHCNNLEAAEMTGRKNVGDSVEELMSHGVKMVVVSMGDKGLVAGYGDSVYSMPGFQVDTIDPTGAGDAFCAGIIKKLLELKGKALRKEFKLDEKQFLEVLAYGEAAGAVCVTAVGTTTAVDGAKVTELLKKQGDSLLSRISKVK